MSIYEKLLTIQTKLNAPKNQYNTYGHYHYRSCEDILAALKPLLQEQEMVLFISDQLELIGERYYTKATVRLVNLEDNKELSNTAYAREEESKKGMDGSQITGASSSYARKYALNGLFGIDDVKDSDTTNTGENDAVFVPSEKQISRLYAIAKSKGHSKEKVDKGIQSRLGKNIEELTKSEYENICNAYKDKE